MNPIQGSITSNTADPTDTVTPTEQDPNLTAIIDLISASQKPPTRLQNLGDHRNEIDPDSPTTPSASILAQYDDPGNLPGPTASSGGKTFFGKVEVPNEDVETYQTVRKHMVEGGARPQKYLAHLENHPDNIPTQISFVTGEGGSFAQPKSDHAYVQVRTDQAQLALSGDINSVATIAAHELAHAARFQLNNDQLQNAESRRTKLENWTNLEEHNVITKIEHPVAQAHNEGLRDDHHILPFESANMTSTLPANAEIRTLVEEAQPKLQEYTKQMDILGLTALDHSHKIVQKRKQIGAQLSFDVESAARRRQPLHGKPRLRTSLTPLPSPVVPSDQRSEEDSLVDDYYYSVANPNPVSRQESQSEAKSVEGRVELPPRVKEGLRDRTIFQNPRPAPIPLDNEEKQIMRSQGRMARTTRGLPPLPVPSQSTTATAQPTPRSQPTSSPSVKPPAVGKP